MSGKRNALWITATVFVVLGLGVAFTFNAITTDPFIAQFNENCGSCHGEDMLGTDI